MDTRKAQYQRLEALLPHGLLESEKWLMQQGISRHALDNFFKSWRLASFSSGLYSLPNVRLSWQGVVCSLQKMVLVSLSGLYAGKVCAAQITRWIAFGTSGGNGVAKKCPQLLKVRRVVSNES